MNESEYLTSPEHAALVAAAALLKLAPSRDAEKAYKLAFANAVAVRFGRQHRGRGALIAVGNLLLQRHHITHPHLVPTAPDLVSLEGDA